MPHYLYMFELKKKKCQKQNLPRSRAQCTGDKLGVLVWCQQRKGRGLRSGQPCDCGCSPRPRLEPEVRSRAVSQPLKAPPRAQSHVRGGAGGLPAPAVLGSCSHPESQRWSPQDSQPPIPPEVPVPSLPCPILTDHTARVSASIFCSPCRFSSSCTWATFCLMAISGPPPYRVLK